MNNEHRQNYLCDTIGSVFHACLRQVCDSNEANRAWYAIKQMPGSEWAGVCSLVAVEIALEWDKRRDDDEFHRRRMIEYELAAGITSFLRKNTNSEEATKAWRALQDLSDTEWREVVYWTADRTYTQLKKCNEE